MPALPLKGPHAPPIAGIDDGIRLEPFNMRREMREGHFDESGFYVLNKVKMGSSRIIPVDRKWLIHMKP